MRMNPITNHTPPAASEADDELLVRARAGDSAAYGELWRRHSEAGKAIARRIGSPDLADDLVAESFVRILSTMQRGKGPVSGFRPYLITTIRNVARRWAEQPQSVYVEDFDQFEDPATLDDPAIAALDRTLTLTAFRSLPERWQTVLWYSEVEGMDPHEIAPFLGMTANATAALSYRARAGLREAWLRAHLKDDSSSPECRWTTKRLSGYVAGKLTERERKTVADHLATCTKCTIVAGELDHIGSRLAFVLFPLLVGSSIGATLLASHAQGSASAAATAAPPLPPHIQLASFSTSTSTRAQPRLSRTSAGRWIAAGAIAFALAGISVAALAATLQKVPAASTHSASSDASNSGSASSGSARASNPPSPPTPESTVPPSQPVTPLVPLPQPVTPSVPSPRVVSRPTTPVAAPQQTAPVTVNPPTPQTAPVIVNSPSTALLTNNASPTISGTGIAGATVSVGEGSGTEVTIVVDPAGNWTVVVPLTDGQHSLAITETSGTSLRSSAVTISITIDTVAPTAPTVTTSIDDTALRPFTIAGTAEPGATLTVYDNTGALLATVTADSSGAWASGPLTGLTPTVTSLQVFQTDLAGNISLATSVGPIAMTPTIVTPANGAQYASGAAIPISVQGWPGTDLQVLLDGNVVAVGGQPFVTLDANGTLSLTVTGLPAGPHSLAFSYVANGQVSPTQEQTDFTVLP